VQVAHRLLAAVDTAAVAAALTLASLAAPDPPFALAAGAG